MSLVSMLNGRDYLALGYYCEKNQKKLESESTDFLFKIKCKAGAIAGNIQGNNCAWKINASCWYFG